MKKEIVLLLCLLAIACCTVLQAQVVVNVYVSPSGSNTGSGSSTASPVSLARARTLVKSTANKANVCRVWLMDGVYSTFSLDTTDSRLATAPVTYSAVNPKKAIFSPITPINPADLQSIPDSIKDRIVDSVAKTKVKQVSLAAYNLSNMNPWPKLFGYPVNITATTSTRLQWPKIYQNTTPLPMAQYPNNDVMRMKSVVTNGAANSVPGGSFKYRDDRAKYWKQAIKDGLWLRGNWRVDWQMDFVKTDSVSLKDSIIYQTIGVQLGIGNKYTRPAGNGKEPYVAVNLVEEIDTVGEWSINFNTKMLYIYPPDSGTLNMSSNSSTPSLKLDRVNNTHFEGILFDGGAGDGIRLNKCNNIQIAGNEIAHVAGYGVFVADGTNCTIRSNDLHDLGEGGVFIINSNFTNDQKNLVPCNHKVVNNHIYNYANDVFLYAAAIDTRSAIGTYSAFNTIHGCEHVGVLFGGNNNVFEYNDISDVVKTYTDMGAFYTSEAMTERGNIIRHNYIHAMGYKGSGLYADNSASGQQYNNNISAQCLLGSQNNFGYFNTFNSNIYFDNSMAHHTNATNKVPDTSAANTNFTRLKTLYNSSAAYRAAYPDLAKFFPTLDSSYASQMWPQLSGNVFLGTSLGGSCIRSIVDNSLFNTNGTTKLAYSKTIPFTQYGLICPDNFLAKKTLLVSAQPSLMDSLKNISLFTKTINNNWHISRIGLHKDSIYRPDVTTTQTHGIVPNFALKVTSKHGFVAKDTLTISVTIKNPNMSKSYSSVLLYDNQAKTNIPFVLKTAKFDSIVLSAQWNNPPVGTHSVTAHLFDSTIWEFASDSFAFSIGTPLPLSILQFSARSVNCAAQLDGQFTPDEALPQNIFLERSIFNGPFEAVFAINPEASNHSFSIRLPQENPTALYRVKFFDGLKVGYSQTLAVSTLCSNKESLAISPNPVILGKEAQVQYTMGSNQQPLHRSLALLDASGKIVLTQSLTLHEGLNRINLQLGSHLKPGVYTLRLSQSSLTAQLMVVNK